MIAPQKISLSGLKTGRIKIQSDPCDDTIKYWYAHAYPNQISVSIQIYESKSRCQHSNPIYIQYLFYH